MDWNKKKILAYAGAGLILLLGGLLLYRFLSPWNSRFDPSAPRSVAGIWFGQRADSVRTLRADGLTQLNPVAINKATAEEYRRRAQYPPNSEPIPYEGNIIHDPIVNDAKIIPAKITNPKNPSGPFLYHYLERNNYYPGDTVVIHAYIVQGENDTKIETDKLTVKLSQEGGAAGKILDTQTMYDNGGTGDKAGDRIYTAAFSTNLLKLKPHNYTLIIDYNVAGQELAATNSFNYGTLGIGSTGKFLDWAGSDAEGGPSLFIRGEFKIEERGAYHFVGSLYTRQGVPLGIAQAREELNPGTHLVELRWWGKIFCDSQESGPYVLKYMMVSNVTAMPGSRSPLIENAHTTTEYKWRQFTCAGFNDPLFLEKAKQIEEDLRHNPP